VLRCAASAALLLLLLFEELYLSVGFCSFLFSSVLFVVLAGLSLHLFVLSDQVINIYSLALEVTEMIC